MGAERSHAGAVLLPDGKVLVAGGKATFVCAYASAEIYDPASETWHTTGEMTTPRARFVLTPLADGEVLASGGRELCASQVFASAELYDPETSAWHATGSMAEGRSGHPAVAMPDGRVLVVGGTGAAYAPLATAELYDPSTGAWCDAGRMAHPRGSCTATLLPDGQVLVAGGYNHHALASAELYDPVSGQWRSTGDMTVARTDHSAVLLPNGKVLVAGGRAFRHSKLFTHASAELYDPSTGTWSATGSMAFARAGLAAVPLPSGRVLAAGGADFGGGFRPIVCACAEVYDPCTGEWSPAGTMTDGRANAQSAPLDGARVLLIGGEESINGTSLDSSEIYDESPCCPPISLSPPSLPGGTLGTDYQEILAANGGLAPYTYMVTADFLPNGLKLDPDGTLSGMPAAEGTFRFRVTATDSEGCMGTRNYLIAASSLAPPPVIVSIKKASSPFRFIVKGYNLQENVRVYIDGVQWTGVVWRSGTRLRLTGQGLKDAVPRGTAHAFRFVNPDGGEVTREWRWW